ncbi:hypothetical protein G7Y89_g6917 [Cudoniella acicularis]|uniref:Kelch repeat protein n=1 Tax=Cudoniella acicularis TaxID=354080 RepID=A0A8H4RN02_9HELO|nr:hypothetical protein G7Y89_g6917 [Cudoniella acicularis]
MGSVFTSGGKYLLSFAGIVTERRPFFSLSNSSVLGWSGPPSATSSLIEYDMDTSTWSNSSGPDSTPRAEGTMVYIPASDDGFLVYFGGVTTPCNNSTVIASPMDTIYVYDIASSELYTQTAGGNVPHPRRQFCGGAAWAPDQSSYNIYIYGGLGFGADGAGFNDVYILSLPSFQWINWYNDSGTGRPHHSMTCNVVGGQMLIIGGTFPLDNACDVQNVWRTHNLDMGKSSGSVWSAYEVNNLLDYSSLGGATVTAPPGGFNNTDLSVYFTRKATISSRAPTRVIPSPSTTSTATPSSINTVPSEISNSPILSTGAILGISIGGAILLIGLAAGGIFCLRRHRKNSQNVLPPQLPTPPFSPAPAYYPVELSETPHQLDPK